MLARAEDAPRAPPLRPHTEERAPHHPTTRDWPWNIDSYVEFVDDRQVQIDFTNCRDACAVTTATLADMRRRS